MSRFILFLFSTIISTTSFANTRQHKIKLLGEALEPGKILTVEQIKKDFPNLQKQKISFRDEKEMLYEGIFVSDLIQKYAKPGVTKVKMKATNNYVQVLEKKDIEEWKAFFAFIANGELIPTTTRGTFRVLYDFAKYSGQSDVIAKMENNSVWQVVEITFEK